MMKRKRTYVLTASLALLLGSPLYAYAQNNTPLNWQPRSVQAVREDMTYDDQGRTIYNVQYGDTLSVIAEALEVDLNLLAAVNEVTNVDLIYPDTVFTLNYNEAQEAETLTIAQPEEDDSQDETLAEIDLVNNSVSYQGEDYELEYEPEVETETETETEPVYLTEPVDEFLEESEAEIVTPAEPVEEPAESAEEVVEEVDYTEEIAEPAAEQPLVEPVEEWVEETPIEETTEEPVQTTEPTIEEESTESNLEDESFEEETTLPVEEDFEYVEEIVEEPQYEEPAYTEEIVEEPEYVEEVVEEEVVEEPEYVEEIIEEATPSYDANLSNVENFRQAIINQFGITNIGGYRPGDPGDHGRGKALDVMVPISSATGDAVAQYAIANMGNYGISYVIWKQQIYGDWNQAWEWMEDRGSVTQNHYDHVHISFY